MLFRYNNGDKELKPNNIHILVIFLVLKSSFTSFFKLD